MPFKPVKFPLNAFLADEYTLLQELAAQKHQVLTIDAKEELFVFADEKMISSVLRNLVSNAIKFTPDGGTILVSVSKQGNQAKIAVEDNGVGISSDRLPKLFKIHESTKTYGTRQEDGTGLGLILCKEFVEKNGGDITIDSEVNAGTTVSFTVPLATSFR
jgi:signal transduction histidine kinase